MYLQQQLNDTLDTSSNRTILRIKVIKPSSVLELQGIDRHTIWDHFKNCAPCHLPNLDPPIITSTWIPPLDYSCQVCQRTDDANQMLLCNYYYGGYHLFYLKPELIQIPADIWYCSSCSPVVPWFLLEPCHAFPGSGLGGIHENFLLVSSCALYVYVCASLFGWLVSTFDRFLSFYYWALWQMKKEVVRYSLHWPSNGNKIIDLPLKCRRSIEARIPGLYPVERPSPFFNIFLLWNAHWSGAFGFEMQCK